MAVSIARVSHFQQQRLMGGAPLVVRVRLLLSTTLKIYSNSLIITT
jgi:hypothetical protein